MTNPLNEATYEWHPTETVEMDTLTPLEVALLVSRERKQHELSGRNGSSYTLTEVGQVTDPTTGATFAVTEHDYGMGIERECTCRDFEPGRPCQHLRAFEAQAARQHFGPFAATNFQD
jgi:hypothetical protein